METVQNCLFSSFEHCFLTSLHNVHNQAKSTVINGLQNLLLAGKEFITIHKYFQCMIQAADHSQLVPQLCNNQITCNNNCKSSLFGYHYALIHKCSFHMIVLCLSIQENAVSYKNNNHIIYHCINKLHTTKQYRAPKVFTQNCIF